MDVSTEYSMDILQFIAEVFFLPPKLDNILPRAKINLMNTHLNISHPWVELNHSLAALSTLNASKNNVFAIMLQTFPSESLRDKDIDLKDISKIKAARFLCADNWDQNGDGKVGKYMTNCIEKILAASKSIEDERHSEFDIVVKDFINYVYQETWEKFCLRMTKSHNRAQSLVLFLEERLEDSHHSTPPKLPELIQAISVLLGIIQSPKRNQHDYADVHEACTRVRQEAFLEHDTKNWLTGQKWGSKGAKPSRVLQKIVKQRNAIETLISLLKNPEMRATFQAARTAHDEGKLITWAPPGPRSGEKTITLNLEPNSKDETEIKKAYDNALSLSDGGEQKYARSVQMWRRISTNITKLNKKTLPAGYNRQDKTFTFTTTHSQHCEGKLLRFVIENSLLGKVFPYIGCGKLCCEPCFTAITAVNELIRKSNTEQPDKVCFAVDGTHRKIYPGFGITPIETEEFKTTALTGAFKRLLCQDIGLLVKKGVEKGQGGSDSDP